MQHSGDTVMGGGGGGGIMAEVAMAMVAYDDLESNVDDNTSGGFYSSRANKPTNQPPLRVP
jgi:hypothetical protein